MWATGKKSNSYVYHFKQKVSQTSFTQLFYPIYLIKGSEVCFVIAPSNSYSEWSWTLLFFIVSIVIKAAKPFKRQPCNSKATAIDLNIYFDWIDLWITQIAFEKDRHLIPINYKTPIWYLMLLGWTRVPCTIKSWINRHEILRVFNFLQFLSAVSYTIETIPYKQITFPVKLSL